MWIQSAVFVLGGSAHGQEVPNGHFDNDVDLWASGNGDLSHDSDDGVSNVPGYATLNGNGPGDGWMESDPFVVTQHDLAFGARDRTFDWELKIAGNTVANGSHNPSDDNWQSYAEPISAHCGELATVYFAIGSNNVDLDAIDLAGTICIAYQDSDGDGDCPFGEDLNGDDDCADWGEPHQVPWDCDDGNPDVYDGAPEIPGSGIDEDCDGLELCYVDSDLDGFGEAATVADADLTCSTPGLANNPDDLCDGHDAWGDSDGDGLCDDIDFCLGDNATGDSDKDGVCDDLDLCLGDDATGDSDKDGTCDNLDLCFGDDTSGDTDDDGLCDDSDLCFGTDATGDSDKDGYCDDNDICLGDDDSGDADGDLICNDSDLCLGDNAFGDEDGDGLCGDQDHCFGNADQGDSDGDGVCDDLDLCEGDDLTGDSDEDGVCGDRDPCFGDQTTGDDDKDGVCDDLDPCFGDQTTGDVDEDDVCDDLDACEGDDASGDSDDDGLCDDIDPPEGTVPNPGATPQRMPSASAPSPTASGCRCDASGGPGAAMISLLTLLGMARRRWDRTAPARITPGS